MKQSDTKQDLLKTLVQVRQIVSYLKGKNQSLNLIVSGNNQLQTAKDEIERLHKKISSMETELYYYKNMRDTQNRLHYYSMNEYRRSPLDDEGRDEAGMDYISDRGKDSGSGNGIYDTLKKGVEFVQNKAGSLLQSDSQAKSGNVRTNDLVSDAFKVNLSDATSQKTLFVEPLDPIQDPDFEDPFSKTPSTMLSYYQPIIGRGFKTETSAEALTKLLDTEFFSESLPKLSKLYKINENLPLKDKKEIIVKLHKLMKFIFDLDTQGYEAFKESFNLNVNGSKSYASISTAVKNLSSDILNKIFHDHRIIPVLE